MNSDRPAPSSDKGVHGHTGPTTPAEDKMAQADPAVSPPEDRVKIAEAASREEDA